MAAIRRESESIVGSQDLAIRKESVIIVSNEE